MQDETIKRILEDSETYDDSRENTLREMLGDFYSRKMMSVAILVWVWGLVFIAGAVYSAVRFFDDIGTKDQIMYAALFIIFLMWLGLMKVFAWLMITRNGIKREVKRLELRIAELAKVLSEKEWHRPRPALRISAEEFECRVPIEVRCDAE
mgnify:CR=1 FL=1